VTKRKRARSARAMAIAMRVVGDTEGKGGKAMAMATRMDCNGNEEGNGNIRNSTMSLTTLVLCFLSLKYTFGSISMFFTFVRCSIILSRLF
jgi:hypothetical protein